MVSRKEDKIDFALLELELNEAVEADAKYRRENDAKFRAVDQKVASYEEFRNIVLASHLKPLDKSDKITAESFKQPWNCAVSSRSSNDRKLTPTAAPSTHTSVVVGTVLRTCYEFMKQWRLCDSSQRYSLLINTGAERIRALFCAEIDCTLLSQVLSVLEENCNNVTDLSTVLPILEAFTTVSRFELTLALMSEAEHQACSTAFNKLSSLLEQVNIKLREQQESKLEDPSMTSLHIHQSNEPEQETMTSLQQEERKLEKGSMTALEQQQQEHCNSLNRESLTLPECSESPEEPDGKKEQQAEDDLFSAHNAELLTSLRERLMALAKHYHTHLSV